MKRYVLPWLVVAAVPACGSQIDMGGPRPSGSAGSSAVTHVDQRTPSDDAMGDNGGVGEGAAGSTGEAPQAPQPQNADAAGGAGPSAETGDGGSADLAAGGSDSSFPTTGRYAGSFKVLVLSKSLNFVHDSIPACEGLLTALGQTPDGLLPKGAAPGSQFAVDIAKDDLSDFTDDKLEDYGMLFWCNATGPVFSQGGENGAIAMAAVQNFVEGGGAWGGVHAATDFEGTGGFPWFTDTLVGASFQTHDPDGTPGTVQVEPGYAKHPVMRGIPVSWKTHDEWYYMTRDIRTRPGFQVLASLASDQRPVVWTKQLGAGGDGRMFYTTRGHNSTVYDEPDFRRLILNGILWATHRLK